MLQSNLPKAEKCPLLQGVRYMEILNISRKGKEDTLIPEGGWGRGWGRGKGNFLMSQYMGMCQQALSCEVLLQNRS